MEALPSFALRSMFGFKTAYLDGLLMLMFAAKEPPWQGVLVCTEKGHHASLMQEFSALQIHPIISKWLILPEGDDRFEESAGRLVALAVRRDPRIGVLPKPKKRRSKS